MADFPCAQRLQINGRLVFALVAPNDTLLSVLREKLDLIGTKQGCDKGDCGACTVLLQGQPILSCLSLAALMNEAENISTIEGVGEPKDGQLLLEAFDRSGALQCGFCQPGMILAALALLRTNNQPSLAEIKEALSGNLCRCTGYNKIYVAILCAAQVLNGEASSIEEALNNLERT
jgi:2-isopropylmalate synthase